MEGQRNIQAAVDEEGDVGGVAEFCQLLCLLKIASGIAGGVAV